MAATSKALDRLLSWPAAVVVVIAAVAALALPPLSDPDVAWNTAAGRYLLDHGAEPPLSFYGEHGAVEDSPLRLIISSVVLGAAFGAGGFAGLLWLRLALGVLLALVVARVAGGGRSPSAWLWTGVVVGGTAIRGGPRDETFAVLALAVLLVVLEPFFDRGAAAARSSTTRLIGRVAAVFMVVLVWAFSHGSAPLAVLVTGALPVGLLAARAQRRVGLAALACVAAAVGAVLVALGPAGAIAVVVAGHSEGNALAVGEWAPLPKALLAGWREAPLASFGVLLCLVSAAAIEMRARGAVCLSRVVVAVGLGTLGVLAIHGLAFAAVGLAVAAPLVDARARLFRPLAVAGVAAVLLLFGLRAHGTPLYRARTAAEWVPPWVAPRAAFAALRARAPHALVFGRFDYLNYHLLEGYPDARVVWCGRQTYSVATFRDIARARVDGGAAFAEVMTRLGVDAVLVRLLDERAFFSAAVREGWTPIHVDLRFAVFTSPRLRLAPVTLPKLGALLAAEFPPLHPEVAEVLVNAFCERFVAVGRGDDVGCVAAADG